MWDCDLCAGLGQGTPSSSCLARAFLSSLDVAPRAEDYTSRWGDVWAHTKDQLRPLQAGSASPAVPAVDPGVRAGAAASEPAMP